MIINVRTEDNLLILLRNYQSGNWKVGVVSEPRITKVRVFNWDVTQVFKGDYDSLNSNRDANDRLILGIKNCRIENFYAAGTWSDLFGSAAVVYTEEVSIQIQGIKRIGIVRENYDGPLSQNEIDEYFGRLKREIQLRGINKIVFRGGGTISVPEFFKNWCQENSVIIEILEDDELDRLYPVELDILFDRIDPEQRG
jgi:hypothetical protein